MAQCAISLLRRGSASCNEQQIKFAIMTDPRHQPRRYGLARWRSPQADSPRRTSIEFSAMRSQSQGGCDALAGSVAKTCSATCFDHHMQTRAVHQTLTGTTVRECDKGGTKTGLLKNHASQGRHKITSKPPRVRLRAVTLPPRPSTLRLTIHRPSP